MNLDINAAALSHPEFSGNIGFASVVITPPEGIYARLWGSAKHDVAGGIHLPLRATALFLQCPVTGTTLVLLTLDLVALWQEEVDRIQRRILDCFDLSPQQLMIHVSHTHSSPMLARRHYDRPGGAFIGPYLDSLPDKCCELVSAARASMTRGILSWAYGSCHLAFNRDAVDIQSGRGVCGLNLDRSADDTLLVGRVTDANARIRGVIVNYACHPVSLGGANTLLSPDYVGPMRDLVEREAGGTCIFLHGASGDLTPRRSYEATVAAAEQNGRELGYAVLATLNSMIPPGRVLEYSGIEESGTALGVWEAVEKQSIPAVLEAKLVQFQLALKELPPREEIVARLQLSSTRYEIERLERMLAMKDRLGNKTEGTLPVTVWRLGDAFAVATGGEAYSRFQIALREQFPHTAIAVLNLTNGATSYLPEAAAYGMDNYPARVTEYAAGCLERSIEQALVIMRDLG